MAWPQAVSRPDEPRGVAHHDDVAGRGLDLRLVEEPVAVLGERPAVHVEQYRIALGRVEVGRGEEPAVDLGPVGRRGAEALGRNDAGAGGEALGQRSQPPLLAIGADGVQLRRALDRRGGEGHRVTDGVEAGDDPLAPHRQQRGAAAVGCHAVQVQVAAVLAGGDDLPADPDRALGSGEGSERAVEARGHPPSITGGQIEHADHGVLGIGQGIVLAEEGHLQPVG